MKLRRFVWILGFLFLGHFLLSRAVVHFCEFTFFPSGGCEPVHPDIYPFASRYGIVLLFPFVYPYQGYFIRFLGLGRQVGSHVSIPFNSLFQSGLFVVIGMGFTTAIKKLSKFSQNKTDALDGSASRRRQ